jgi:hypothetical protein
MVTQSAAEGPAHVLELGPVWSDTEEVTGSNPVSSRRRRGSEAGSQNGSRPLGRRGAESKAGELQRDRGPAL